MEAALEEILGRIDDIDAAAIKVKIADCDYFNVAQDLWDAEHAQFKIYIRNKFADGRLPGGGAGRRNKARMKTDVVSEKKYSDRILETLRKYHDRAIETAQVIEELIQMAKDMAEDAELAEKSGLNPDEIAFYRSLIQNESAVKELGDNDLRERARRVTA